MECHDRTELPVALTLSQLAGYVAQALTRQPVLLGTWVSAEISDLSTSGGHCYMTLIEKDPSGTTIARMRATIWANRYLHIRHKFLAATGQELANGLKVMLYGGINYHSSYGMSFNVGEIDPSYTMGDLERIRREILAALQKEGVIGRNRGLRIAEPPLRVAVISSEKAAGYGDFIHQLQANPLGVEFHTLLFPAVMQGEKTADSVMAALDLVEQTRSIAGWDCVVIIRGGGATTDMNGFDNLDLARRVATFPLPVAVGIGHERDRCVLDEIACIRCKTPTAVAAWLIDTVGARWQQAVDLTTRIASYASQRLNGEKIRLQAAQTMIPAAASARIANAGLQLRSISSRLPLAAKNVTDRHRTRLANIATTLRMASLARMEKEALRLENLGQLVEVLSPTATLRRGYTITRAGGKAVTAASRIRPGDNIETITADGVITSTAVETKRNQTL